VNYVSPPIVTVPSVLNINKKWKNNLKSVCVPANGNDQTFFYLLYFYRIRIVSKTAENQKPMQRKVVNK
jgi:hypothetical protein